MIIYDMGCDSEHRFEGWFREQSDYLHQLEKRLISCPVCGSHEVRKVMTASRIRTSTSERAAGRENETEGTASLAVAEYLDKLKEYVAQNFTDVGEQFPEEARKVYYGETEARSLCGTAKKEEIVDLLEEGIVVTPLPVRHPGKLN